MIEVMDLRNIYIGIDPVGYGVEGEEYDHDES
jgi:hypothetical protein